MTDADPVKIVDSLFDDLVKSRFIEMFGHINNSDYKTVDLLGKIGTGNTPSMKIREYYENKDYCFIKPSDLQDNVTQLFESENKLDIRSKNISRIFPKGTVLVSCIGSIGKVAISNMEIASCNQQINYIIPFENVDSIYLAYAILFNREQLLSIANAPVVPIVNKSQFSKIRIPLPSFEEQKVFSDFVNQVDKSRFIAKQQFAMFDDLIKSKFIEMFGTIDLSSQKEEWRRIGDVGTILTGSTPKTSEPSFWDGDLKWIAPAELTSESYIINDTERKITEAGRRSCSLNLLKPGVVLLSSRAPIGKVGIVGSEMYCNQGFKNIECGPELNNVFLYVLLKNNGGYLNSLGRGATFKEISAKIVENIRIPVPPLERQEQFVTFFNQVDKSRFMIVDSVVNKLNKHLIGESDDLVCSR